MDNKEFLEVAKQADTPRKILALILKYEDFLGYDPYFGDLRKAMLQQAKRVLEEKQNVP